MKNLGVSNGTRLNKKEVDKGGLRIMLVVQRV